MLTRFGKGLRHAALLAVAVVSLFGANAARAAHPYQYAVDVTATPQTAPAQVRLNWVLDSAATGYTVSRKLPTAANWTTLTSLPGNVNGYTDGNVTAGSAFEYRVVKTLDYGITAYGYVLAGIDAPITESRGKLILVVDNTHAAALAAELTRLQAGPDGRWVDGDSQGCFAQRDGGFGEECDQDRIRRGQGKCQSGVSFRARAGAAIGEH